MKPPFKLFVTLAVLAVVGTADSNHAHAGPNGGHAGHATASVCVHDAPVNRTAPLSFIAPDSGLEVPLAIFRRTPHDISPRTPSDDAHWGPALDARSPSE